MKNYTNQEILLFWTAAVSCRSNIFKAYVCFMVEELEKKLLDVLVATPSAIVEHACDGLLLKIGAETVVVAVSHLSHDCQHRAERRQQSRRNSGALEGGTHAKLAFV